MRRLLFILGVLALAILVCSCTGPPSSPTYAISGRATAGPTCPVQPANPAPGECEPRPVAGAILVIVGADGREVARVTTGPDGTFTTTLPAGAYALNPQPVSGLLGTAAPVDFTVSDTGPAVTLEVAYDTGIR